MPNPPSSRQQSNSSEIEQLYVVPLPITNDLLKAGEESDLMGVSPNQNRLGVNIVSKVPLEEILNAFCQKVSQSLENKNLKWEAEIELGLEFGFTVKTKIKISPKD